MTELIDRMRRAADASRALEHHFPADVLSEAAAVIQRLEGLHDGQVDRIGRLRARYDDEWQRANRAEAALARVTDDSTIERIAVAIHKAVCLAPDHPECRPSSEDFRKAREAIKAVRAAAEGQEQGGTVR